MMNAKISSNREIREVPEWNTLRSNLVAMAKKICVVELASYQLLIRDEGSIVLNV